jgi:NAD(P) transhydrogenase subunit alpha
MRFVSICPADHLPVVQKNKNAFENCKRYQQNMEDILNRIATNHQIIYIVILMIFVGIEVIGRVPSVLHTPLMSGANAIHGVVIIGAIIVIGKPEQDNYVALTLGFLAVVLGTLNVVGGFVVTDRMLEMFKAKKKK